MIKITSTKDFKHTGAKVLVYSPAGVGKTVLASTAPNPIIISAESGLMSLQEIDVPVIEVKTLNDVLEVYEWNKSSDEAKQYKTLCLDSITEIAEVMLAQYKSEEKDPRAAYGRLADDMSGMIRGFRDTKDKNVYFSAKQVKLIDESNGVTTYVPSMPGKQLLNGLPFFFDLVMPMKVGKLEDGTVYRYLQTHADLQFEGKDRSGKLDPVEEPNLTKLFNKIIGIGESIVKHPDEKKKPENKVIDKKKEGEKKAGKK